MINYQELVPNEWKINFNGTDISQYFYLKETPSGRGVVGREVKIDTIGNRPGGFLRGTRLPVRVITLEVLFAFSSESELKKKQEELNYILHTDDEKPLVFFDEPDRTYNAIFESLTEGETKGGLQHATLTFLCSDPKKYGAEAAYELGKGVQTFTNPSLAPIEPQIECIFTAAATSYEVALLHSDESVNKVIKVVHNFIEGDTLIIDIAKRKVLNNGKAIMNGLQIKSEFFDFPAQKPVKLKFSHKSSIKFKEAYL
ncbi:phage tail family protein [Bacillus altitudinis]|uniref:distal tail protein Dit n=1 Tax=Bacillus altitudinis TaxID=293387 RepID=UPI003459E1E9